MSQTLPTKQHASKQHASEVSTSTSKPKGVQSVAIVGLGYVGLPLALLAEERGLSVRGFDTDTRKISSLRNRTASFLSSSENHLLRKSIIEFSTDETILRGADVIIVCVPTPVDERHRPELAPLIAACESIARHIEKGTLVIIESTVNPGACETFGLSVIERGSGLRGGKDFFFAHCPERINPGDTKWNVRTIPRVVGGTGPESLARAVSFYEGLVDAEILPMASIKEAEAVKMVENSFRDINIAFVNELAMSFARTDIDVMNVIRGASTKPFSFMPHFPGCGVGGHCIPVDPYYLIRYGRQNGFEHRFLATAREINNGMPRYTVDLLEKTLIKKGKKLAGATIALLGLAYKREVPDVRESPAISIRAELMLRGALVNTFDPYVKEDSTANSVLEALADADAAIIATDHTVFRELSPQLFLSQGVGIVIDGRNCLSKEAFISAGLTYRGIGR